MAVIKLTELEPPVKELQKREMRGIFGGIILGGYQSLSWGGTATRGFDYDTGRIAFDYDTGFKLYKF
ncbi:MAG: hypothetical protein ACYC2T_14385 [Bacillota bacterium]